MIKDGAGIKGAGGSEDLIFGLGALIATAVLLLLVFSLFRATLPADRSVALQSAASEVAGDVATVATVSVPYSHTDQYTYPGICLYVSSDYVTALDSSGDCFARPLAVRVHPGRYSGHGVSWNDTAEFRACLNASFGADGSETSPINSCNASSITSLLASVRVDMAATPLTVDPSRPLVIEKQLIYVRNSSYRETECIPCVFVYQ